MSIDFHAVQNRNTYASRRAAQGWMQTMQLLANPAKKIVYDIGCGGGIYARGWAEMGAKQVTGIDFSDEMIGAAIQASYDFHNLSFQKGSAYDTGLPTASADIIFNRAVIHHLDDLPACLNETHRLLKPGGTFILQDRTPADVQLPGNRDHIRGYFFSKFPRLLKIENKRRPDSETIEKALSQAGFINPQTLSLWETRQAHPNPEALAEDLKLRTGRSILHELSDSELDQLIEYILTQLPSGKKVVEQDRWTIWTAERKPIETL